MIELNSFINGDCMDGMAQFPDKYFELAIVDPPYRDAKDNAPTKDMREKGGNMRDFGNKPNKVYFDELFRVSKNQIIWGANNFELPIYKGFVVWRKTTISDSFTMSMAEIAYLSEGLATTSKVFDCAPQGTAENPRIHPTQKPVKLYEWLLGKYAHTGDKILDTHVGSASSLIACHKLHFDYIGFELDPDYYRMASDRLESAKSQMKLL